MSYESWAAHWFAHSQKIPGCPWCEMPESAQTCTPENPINADEPPFTVIETITLHPVSDAYRQI